ncbi:SAM-dependent methyltransferase [Endozoicomonas elysicola]|uniref:Methyltransferase domain-containing protein n=1 Tax=Endozoicomonas elysicola TaxID=305900 RepID=A0A081KFL7_9GAMM|nr:class I SAM-dependent methyltransferase [Endozoicomonas elysicola]KEI72943.1 hypothetical protein GV64_21425 [Endozoicomonas elysicola]
MRLNRELLALAFRQWFYQWQQSFREVKRYGRKPRFLIPWLWLKLSYLLDGPYAVSRRYHRRIKSESIYVYGETPLTTLEMIAEKTGVTSDDHVFELGAGSGYTSLWLHGVKKCQVTAIEQVPLFCWRLHRTARRMRLSSVNVRCEDYMQSPLDDASIVYLYASNLDDHVISELAERLADLSAGVKIITVSYALQPFLHQQAFKITDQFTVPFEWGEAEVFVQERMSATEILKIMESSSSRLEHAMD